MAETQTSTPLSPFKPWHRMDKALLAICAILVALAFFDPPAVWPSVRFTLEAFAHTAPFIAFAVLAVAYMKASGAENLLAKAFEGPKLRMIIVAALVGGLSPFCSCEVIPFIAAMLAMGAPLGAVMAFWLASPLMDPAMFSITMAELGMGFAVAKTVAAVLIGVFGGLAILSMSGSAFLANPLKEPPKTSCCSCGPEPLSQKPVWRFWTAGERRETFRKTAIENAFFLGKWLMLAYLVEALMLRYVPAEWIASFLGGDGIKPILLGALAGGPAYLNGYAAVPLVSTLLDQGMSNGAAMSFVIAGGISCIPAAIAVWALVKPRVFACYLAFALIGSVFAGLTWNLVA